MIKWWLRYCAVIFMIFGEWASDWGGPVTGETRYKKGNVKISCLVIWI